MHGSSYKRNSFCISDNLFSMELSEIEECVRSESSSQKDLSGSFHRESSNPSDT